jgi:hypothetical protein
MAGHKKSSRKYPLNKWSITTRVIDGQLKIMEIYPYKKGSKTYYKQRVSQRNYVKAITYDEIPNKGLKFMEEDGRSYTKVRKGTYNNENAIQLIEVLKDKDGITISVTHRVFDKRGKEVHSGIHRYGDIDFEKTFHEFELD